MKSVMAALRNVRALRLHLDAADLAGHERVVLHARLREIAEEVFVPLDLGKPLLEVAQRFAVALDPVDQLRAVGDGDVEGHVRVRPRDTRRVLEAAGSENGHLGPGL